MRLQTESRRMSQLAVDSSARVNGTPSPNKRMSLLISPPPNPQRGHRRISSQSDSGLTLGEGFQWASPPSSSLALTDDEQSFTSKEIQGLKQEIKSLKDALEETKHELLEANEAREASEQCAKALRDYISEFRVGEVEPSLSNMPPPPTTPPKVEDPKGSSKWSFKLWNGVASPSITPATPLSPPTSSSVLAPVPSPQPPALTRKIGSFFSSRTGSVSSTTSFTTPPPTQQQSMYRASSDVSSVTEEEEPNSPYSDTSKTPAQIVIRQFAAGSPGSDVDGGNAYERGKQSGDSVSTPTQRFPIVL